jgi:hypothetical protein
MTQAELIETLIDALGIDETDLSLTFDNGNMMIVAKNVDEDVFDEDEDFDDGDDE